MDGLYGNLSSSVGDFATAVYRAQLMGFNAVRMPFRHVAVSTPRFLLLSRRIGTAEFMQTLYFEIQLCKRIM